MLYEETAQVVDAVGVVGVLVGEEHRVEAVDLGVKQLLAQIGRGIDQDAGDAAAVTPLDQQRGPPAAVLGIFRIADAPAEGRPWDAA